MGGKRKKKKKQRKNKEKKRKEKKKKSSFKPQATSEAEYRNVGIKSLAAPSRNTASRERVEWMKPASSVRAHTGTLLDLHAVRSPYSVHARYMYVYAHAARCGLVRSAMQCRVGRIYCMIYLTYPHITSYK